MSQIQDWMRAVFAAATRDSVDRGFKVKGVVAERRYGKTLQRVALQTANRSQEDFGQFFVNIWVEFDELDGHSWSPRLEHFVKDQPASWNLHSSTDRGALADALRAGLAGALDRLDAIDSAKTALVELVELGAGGTLEDRARLYAAAGHPDEAKADLIELARTFPDRFDLAAMARELGLAIDLESVDLHAPPTHEHNRAILRTLSGPGPGSIEPPPSPMGPGSRVMHAKFGTGTIVGRKDDKWQIEFADGMRWIAERFVRRADT